MQRTVKSTRFTYVVNELTETGEIKSEVKTVEVAEVNPKKALKLAIKKVGLFAPVNTEIIEGLYILDDEIFFQYAKKVEK